MLENDPLAAFWMPFTANRAYKATPRQLVAAKDMHYTASDGRQVLDGTAGLWCVNAGHGRRDVQRYATVALVVVQRQRRQELRTELERIDAEQAGRQELQSLALLGHNGLDLGLLLGRQRERLAEALNLLLGSHPAATAATATGTARATLFGRRSLLRDADHGESRGAQGEHGDKVTEGGLHIGKQL